MSNSHLGYLEAVTAWDLAVARHQRLAEQGAPRSKRLAARARVLYLQDRAAIWYERMVTEARGKA